MTSFKKFDKYDLDVKLSVWFTMDLETKNLLREDNRNFLRATGINPDDPISEKESLTMDERIISEKEKEKTLTIGQIRQLLEEGLSVKDISRIFNVIIGCSFLQDLNIKMEEVTRSFCYGIHRRYKDQLKPGHYRIHAAWTLGFTLQEILSPSLSRISVIDEDVFDVLKIFPYPSPMTIQQFLDYISDVLFAKDYTRTSDSDKLRLIYFIKEANRRGIKFCDSSPKDYKCITGRYETFDYSIIPFVKHINHIKLLPNWPNIFKNVNPHDFYGTRFIPLISYIKDEYFPYPNFSKTLWNTYPQDLKNIIFTFLCCFRTGRLILLDKNLIFLILNYVVLNYYLDLEEKMEEWKELAAQYENISKETFRDRCIDSFICSNAIMRKDLKYVKSLNDLGYSNIKSSCRYFVCHFDIRAWKVIKSIKSSETNYLKFMETVYKHNLALSLIRKGKIKITETGEIVDLEEAIELSNQKRAKDRQAGLNRLSRKPTRSKRLRIAK